MPANPLTDPNWATDTTDIVVSFIDKVRSKTTPEPGLCGARGGLRPDRR